MIKINMSIMIRVFIGIVIFLALSVNINARQVIVLNTANDSPNSTKDYKGINDLVLKEAFRRIGYDLKIIRLPSERALINANEGIEDGNFARIEGLSSIYPNLIQVPEEITRFEFVIFSKKSDLVIKGWNSLKPFHVGIVTGWKILETNITGTKSLTKVKDGAALFNFLKADRVEIIVYDKRQGLALIKDLGMKNIRVIEPPLAVKGMYPYLHKKHKELVPKLADAIREMKKDGTYKKIVNEALASIMRGVHE